MLSESHHPHIYQLIVLPRFSFNLPCYKNCIRAKFPKPKHVLLAVLAVHQFLWIQFLLFTWMLYSIDSAIIPLLGSFLFPFLKNVIIIALLYSSCILLLSIIFCIKRIFSGVKKKSPNFHSSFVIRFFSVVFTFLRLSSPCFISSSIISRFFD